MITRRQVLKLLDDYQREAEACWTILCVLKGENASDDWASQMLEFQPRLAATLFHLDSMYRDLHRERKSLLRRHGQLSRTWLRQRLKTIERYHAALNEAIIHGKALGDSFAWFFYNGSREALLKHVEHEAIPHFPPGDGGRGELEFIRNVKQIAGRMVIYHGTTTFLRLGDISLVNLKTLAVDVIAELKSKRVGENVIEVSVYFVSGDEFATAFVGLGPADPNFEMPSLPAPAQERLQKQMLQMLGTFEVSSPTKHLDYDGDSQIGALNQLVEELQHVKTVYKQAGEGLLLVGIRLRKRRLMARSFLDHCHRDWGQYLGSLTEQCIAIMDVTQAGAVDNANSLRIGNVKPSFLAGTVPLFWWPVPLPFLREVFFGQVLLVTLYNPAHLARKLRDLGLRVSMGENGKLLVTGNINEGELEVHGMDYFISTIQDYLLHENYIISILSEVIADSKNGQFQSGAKIQVRLQHHYADPRQSGR